MDYIEVVNSLNDKLNDFLLGLGIWAPILSSLGVYLEGILAFLPLVVFVTINVMVLGPFWGGLVSWIFTVLGGFSTFLLCRKGFSNFFQKFIRDKKNINTLMSNINKLSFSQLVMIICIPFAPSFFINVCAGLSKISVKKYFLVLLIGKIFTISYLVLIGANLFECLTNPVTLAKVILLFLGAYVVSKIVNKKFDVDERFL